MELLLGAINIAGDFAAVYVFTAKLKHGSRKNYALFLISALALLCAAVRVEAIVLDRAYPVIFTALCETAKIAALGFAAHSCISSGWLGSFYPAIWSIMTAEFLHELPLLILRLPGLSDAYSTALYLVLRFALTTVVLLILLKTAAVTMPQSGVYRIGPRQFTSAVTITILHIGIFSYLMTTNWMTLLPWPYLLVLVFAQGYCLIVLYLQNELFRKSAMKKEMEAVNALLYKRKQQYEIARQNIQLINRRVHDLKLLISGLEKDRQDRQTMEVLEKVQEAAGIYDSVVKTGSDVLDTVLTDKSLVCESKGIKISCVADGQSLAFIDAVDIFTIFNNILDECIDAVCLFQDTSRRSIDILVHTRQKFLVINILHPIFQAVKFKDGLPVPRNESAAYVNYNIKAVREILRRYDGLLNCEEKNGVFTYRIVIPIV